MKIKNEIYVGDGLYISIEHDQFKLRAPREYGDHVIYFDLDMFEQIALYVNAMSHKTK